MNLLQIEESIFTIILLEKTKNKKQKTSITKKLDTKSLDEKR